MSRDELIEPGPTHSDGFLLLEPEQRIVYHLLWSGLVPGRPFSSRALHAFGEGLEAVTLWFFADVPSIGTMAPGRRLH
jgi:hypothetical protein